MVVVVAQALREQQTRAAVEAGLRVAKGLLVQADQAS
jgi:hypothetical protein